MEILVILIVLIVGGLIFAAWAGFGLFLYGERARKRAETKSPQILDIAFDGSQSVVFKINMESPSYETVVLGGRERGYELAHETNDTASGVAKTLIFERKTDG